MESRSRAAPLCPWSPFVAGVFFVAPSWCFVRPPQSLSGADGRSAEEGPSAALQLDSNGSPVEPEWNQNGRSRSAAGGPQRRPKRAALLGGRKLALRRRFEESAWRGGKAAAPKQWGRICHQICRARSHCALLCGPASLRSSASYYLSGLLGTQSAAQKARSRSKASRQTTTKPNRGNLFAPLKQCKRAIIIDESSGLPKWAPLHSGLTTERQSQGAQKREKKQGSQRATCLRVEQPENAHKSLSSRRSNNKNKI